jgi:hypothetical protein
MKRIIEFFNGLFESNYSEYTLLKSTVVQKRVLVQVEDKTWSGGYGITDPMDVKLEHNGSYIPMTVEIWVAYHKKTNLPKYKRIEVL